MTRAFPSLHRPAFRCSILPQPRPFVLQTGLDGFHVSYQLNAYADTDRPSMMPALYSGLHQNIQDRFHEAGVEIKPLQPASLRYGRQPAGPSGEPANLQPPGTLLTAADPRAGSDAIPAASS